MKLKEPTYLGKSVFDATDEDFEAKAQDMRMDNILFGVIWFFVGFAMGVLMAYSAIPSGASFWSALIMVVGFSLIVGLSLSLIMFCQLREASIWKLKRWRKLRDEARR